jgi:membrane fusion protein (multidrug efflux system)
MSQKSAMKRYIFVLIPLLIVAAAAAVIAQSLLRPQIDAPRPPQPVTLAEAVMGPASSALTSIALVEAVQSVELRARVSGFLRERAFTEGDTVEAGRTLFLIEPEQYRAALSAAEADVASATAQMDLAELEFNRLRDLYNKRSVPKSDFDKAASTLDVARAALRAASARLEQAALNLEYTAVKAPFDGRMGDTPFSEGSLLSPDVGVLARIVKTDPVEVTFGLSDKVMSGARLGDPRSGLPGESVANMRPRLLVNGAYYPLDGQITYVAPEVDRQTDTVKFKAVFPNPGGALAPGQSVVVSLEPVEPRQVLLIPKNSVMTSRGQSYVYMTAPAPDGAPGLVSRIQPVGIGFEFADGYEVLSGLAPGDRIINLGLMSGGARLRPGAPVQVVEIPPDGPSAQGQPAEAAPEPAGAGDQAPPEAPAAGEVD